MQPTAPLIGHQAHLDWMGTTVLTLSDLVPAVPLSAVVVGINPAPPSVEVGHYYQGRLGQQFFSRLTRAGLLEPVPNGWQDDAAAEGGIGFTDIVKRPTASASELRAEEYEHGRERLQQHIHDLAAPLVLFTFKKTAEVLLGPFRGHGLLDQHVGGAAAFVMPGPYEKTDKVEKALLDLRRLITGL